MRLYDICKTLEGASLEKYRIHAKTMKTCCVQKSKGKEFGRWNAQGFRYAVDVFKRWVPLPLFNEAYVCSVYSDGFCELFLRNALLPTYHLQIVSKVLENAGIGQWSKWYLHAPSVRIDTRSNS